MSAFTVAIRGKADMRPAPQCLLLTQSGHAPVLSLEDLINHPSLSIARCRELIAVAVSQIDGEPIVSDRLVDPALEVTVAHFKKNNYVVACRSQGPDDA